MKVDKSTLLENDLPKRRRGYATSAVFRDTSQEIAQLFPQALVQRHERPIERDSHRPEMKNLQLDLIWQWRTGLVQGVHPRLDTLVGELVGHPHHDLSTQEITI